MPVNNLIVQYSTKILGFSEYFTSWKEVVMFLIMIGLIYSIIVDFKFIIHKRSTALFKISSIFKLFWPIIIAISLTLLSVISSFIVKKTDLKVYSFGYLFELWWLDFFAIVCNWWIVYKQKLEDLNDDELVLASINNHKFYRGLSLSVLSGFILVATISTGSLLFGPEKTLTPFGYGVVSNSSQFISTTPLCHGVDVSLPECRLMASFTQPIHFAGYLLFIVAFLAVIIYQNKKIQIKFLYVILLLMAIYFIYQSYTRYALLGLAVILSGSLLHYLVSKNDISLRLSKILTGLMLLIPLIISVYFINLDPKLTSSYLPQSLTKEQSTDQHYRHAANSFNIVKKSNSELLFGYGLGATGSASREKYQNYETNPIFQKFYSTNNLWLLNPREFLLTENWFVSVLLNGGIIYALLYLVIVLTPFFSIHKFFKTHKYKESLYLDVLLSLGFFGIILGNLFQHLWENQTLTIYWTILWLWGRMLIWQMPKTKKDKNVSSFKPINKHT